MHEQTCRPPLHFRFRYMLLLTSFLLAGCTSPVVLGRQVSVNTGPNWLTAEISDNIGSITTANRLHIVYTGNTTGLFSEEVAIQNGVELTHTMESIFVFP